MSTAVFPTLNVGPAFPVTRTDLWDGDIQASISGKENRLSYWTYPKYQWEVDINVMKADASNADFQTLIGFINSRQGQFDSFLYQDPTDYIVTTQSIGTGDGSTVAFQLVKTFGGFVEPVLAPKLTATVNIYLNAVLDSGANYTVNPWGTSSASGPGSLVFNSAPGNGVVITADFTYYYPCRFVSNKTAFVYAYSQLYQTKKLSWISVKN